MSAVVINVDMGKRCAECSKPGAVPSGLCLSCSTKAMGTKPMKSAVGKAVRARYQRMRAGGR